MSYNTRRQQGGFPGNSPSASSVGQRRPGPLSATQGYNNSGGQQKQQFQQQQRPQQQQQQQQNRQQQATAQRQQSNLTQQAQHIVNQQQQLQKTPVQQQQSQPQQAVKQSPQVAQQVVKQSPQVAQQAVKQSPQTVQQPPQAAQQPQQAAQPAPQAAQQPKVLFKNEDVPPPPALSGDEQNGGDSDPPSVAKNGEGRKFFWKKRGGNVSKKYSVLRRNRNLRKAIQPKNALMVLNELTSDASYSSQEGPTDASGLFSCIINYEGVDYVGKGSSKLAAKTDAAEAVIKSIVVSKLQKVPDLPAVANTEENADAMEVPDDQANLNAHWVRVASFALHKLLSTWDEGTNLAERLTMKNLTTTVDKRPAKKLPEKAAEMNPIMLLNQMRPNAVYEDAGTVGLPPNVHFTVNCTVGEEVFHGSASTKKVARRLAAFAACTKVLEIQYPVEFLEANGAVKPEEKPEPMQVE